MHKLTKNWSKLSSYVLKYTNFSREAVLTQVTQRFSDLGTYPHGA